MSSPLPPTAPFRGNYSPFANIAFAISLQWHVRRQTVILSVCNIFLRVAVPFLNILLPKLVLDELLADSSPQRFISVIGGFGILLACLSFARAYSDAIVDHSIGTISSLTISRMRFMKQTDLYYELLEDPETIRVAEKAARASNSNHHPAHNVLRIFVLLAANIIGLLLYGGVIMRIHPLIILLLSLSALLSWFLLSKARSYEQTQRDSRGSLFNKLNNLQDCMTDPHFAKDVRLYPLPSFLLQLIGDLQGERDKIQGGISARYSHASATDAVMILIRDGAAYLFLISLLLRGEIALGDFVFTFAAIGTFATWVSGVILQGSDIMRSIDELGDVRRYLELPNFPQQTREDDQQAAVHPATASAPSITLENLSYTYPQAAKPTLQGINLSIKPGERLAIVGANGAGKTTLIKLICGLYRPKEGRILYNDQDLSTIDPLEYYRLIAAVFQDIHLISASIAENISQAPLDTTDVQRLDSCLKQAGLSEKVQSLPAREHTLLVRMINEDAVELSGGEMQKLALARALYKSAPLIILDEPTAALDPIAEQEVYLRYAEFTAGKTSLYISHRLASTRFCDRIILLADGCIAEEGTHDELMKRQGIYSRMFEIQAHYYQDDPDLANSDILLAYGGDADV